jgi:UDP-N-acetyl-D-galactosamine dehydrogenase
MIDLQNVHVGVVGLGYVGLPLAVHLAKHFPLTAFDLNPDRVAALRQGIDHTHEVTPEEFAAADGVIFTSSLEELKRANFYIVAVPTPIDRALQPDMTALRQASATVGGVLDKGDIVVFESTVYPGATEEVCVPILQKRSGLIFNEGFFAGYSPERINPGDLDHRLPDITKVTSGSTPEVADLVDAVYKRAICAGTHKVSSIRVAEAAKVIENIQRDVNIALVNELAQIFKKLEIETREVLDAASTKWNFHAYKPGLVGGHCIGVDPYYLTHKAQSVGFHPEMILAGRRINDGMAAWVALDVIKTMLQKQLEVARSRILILGLTFKENCPDIRNTKVVDLIREFQKLSIAVDVFDPVADRDEVYREYGIQTLTSLEDTQYDAAVVAVRHRQFCSMDQGWFRSLLKQNGVLYDLKNVLPTNASDARL